MGKPWWRPTNDLQRRLLAAVKRGDTAEYLRLIVTAELYLPQLADPDGDARSPLVREVGGTPTVSVFSSPRTMAIGAGDIADTYTTTSYRRLRDQWQDRSLRLAVDPGSAIATFPSLAAIDRAQRGEPIEPGEPGEGALPIVDPVLPRLLAVVEDEVDDQLEALLTAPVTVPTRQQVHQPEELWEAPLHVAGVPDDPTVEAFTRAEAVATAHPDLPNLRLPFPLLLSLLPERVGLVVDPGAAGEAWFRGERLLLVMLAASDRAPARDLTTTRRRWPPWRRSADDPPPMTAQVHGSPPPRSG